MNLRLQEAIGLSNYEFTDPTVTVSSYPEAKNVGPVIVEKDTVKQISLAGRDFADKPITYTIVSGPNSGTLVLDNATGEVTYTNNGTVGEDSFTYQVFHNEDSSVVSTVATVQLDIRERYAAPQPCQCNSPRERAQSL